MYSDPLATLMKTGFPKEVRNRTIIEYVGPHEDIQAGAPKLGQTWGTYPGRVTLVEGHPTKPPEGCGSAPYAVLCVIVDNFSPGER